MMHCRMTKSGGDYLDRLRGSEIVPIRRPKVIGMNELLERRRGRERPKSAATLKRLRTEKMLHVRSDSGLGNTILVSRVYAVDAHEVGKSINHRIRRSLSRTHGSSIPKSERARPSRAALFEMRADHLPYVGMSPAS